jgi:hypothetical protein
MDRVESEICNGELQSLHFEETLHTSCLVEVWKLKMRELK